MPDACPPIKALGIQILLQKMQGTILSAIFLNFMSLLALPQELFFIAPIALVCTQDGSRSVYPWSVWFFCPKTHITSSHLSQEIPYFNSHPNNDIQLYIAWISVGSSLTNILGGSPLSIVFASEWYSHAKEQWIHTKAVITPPELGIEVPLFLNRGKPFCSRGLFTLDSPNINRTTRI